MRISRIYLKNWMNFREADVGELADVVYVLGANAAGKSNLLEAIRFVRDLAKTRGGGLQQAIESRGGIKKIRCLHARKDTEVVVALQIADDELSAKWSYEIAFNLPGSGHREPQVVRETVKRTNSSGGESILLERPDKKDKQDSFLLRETSLEQASANAEFRDLASFLGSVSYVHLVPQLLKFGDQIGGRVLEDDPFGQEFLFRIARTQARTRDARLRRVEKALQAVVPQLEDLQFVKDEITGQPHLEMRFKHHRPRGAKQREDQFSDGTLRIIALLWLMQESGGGPLLLEEPELSLNEDVVRQLPELFSRIVKSQKTKRQIILTTHSEALLSNPGINSDSLLLVIPSDEGSQLRKTSEQENNALSVGLSPGEVVLPVVRKANKALQLTLDL
ncbi:recombination protein F [Roseovarius indicus]|uniref:Recombination protein F n=3 Tax=Roseovarius indicus TaxID=540747 RepID=A0A0T5PG33_9RHOB|nr:hypothetical protein XM52_01240 [Roseovarius indicus]QEW29180.1 recombination protein F [Roseovarius indicus]SFD78423.1 Predicted ATPase [Roseovarius indicus]